MTRQRKQDGPRSALRLRGCLIWTLSNGHLKAMAPRVCEILREEEGD